MTPKQSEIDECYRRMNLRSTNEAEKFYYSGKIEALRADQDTPWRFAEVVNEAMELLKSDDIRQRAKGCGMLYGNPLDGQIDRRSYRFKGLNDKDH